MVVLVDQDVCLERRKLGSGPATKGQDHTPLRSPCITSRLCRYISPLVTSLSYQEVDQRQAYLAVARGPYKLEPIHVLMHLNKLVDVLVVHPL